MNALISFVAQYLIYLAAVVAFIYWLRLPQKEKIQFILVFIIAGIIAVILSKGIAHFYFDTRPFVREGKVPLFPHVSDNGFPSDHTTLTMLTALIMLPYAKRAGWFLALCSLLIGITRVLALIHSPIDIIGSIVIASFSVWVGSMAACTAGIKRIEAFFSGSKL